MHLYILFIHWLLLSSCILLFCCTSLTEQLYVKSSDSAASCPNKPCLTLSELAQNTSQYIVPNTVVNFLPGHHVNTNIFFFLLIKDVWNISLVGSDVANNDSKCVIQCTAPMLIGFNFINVTHLRISHLTILFCRRLLTTATLRFLREVILFMLHQ